MNAPRLFLALVLVMAAAPLRAATFCVYTESQLDNALQAASDNGVDDDILIRAGTILNQGQDTSAFTVVLQGTESLSISGGWVGGANQCVSQLPLPVLTILDGNDRSRVLSITRAPGSTGSFALRNLTLQRGRNLESGGCLRLLPLDAAATGPNLIEGVVFTGCSGGIGAGLSMTTPGGTSTLRNLLFRDNASASTSALSVLTEGTVNVANLTVVDNLGTGDTSAARFLTLGAGAIFVGNSVFWNNVASPGMADLELVGSDITLVRNLFGSRSGSTPTVLSNNNLGVDPRFATDGVRLSASSPARDFGSNSPFGGVAALDLDGRPRIQGDRVDLGAYESAAILADGFE